MCNILQPLRRRNGMLVERLNTLWTVYSARSPCGWTRPGLVGSVAGQWRFTPASRVCYHGNTHTRSSPLGQPQSIEVCLGRTKLTHPPLVFALVRAPRPSHPRPAQAPPPGLLFEWGLNVTEYHRPRGSLAPRRKCGCCLLLASTCHQLGGGRREGEVWRRGQGGENREVGSGGGDGGKNDRVESDGVVRDGADRNQYKTGLSTPQPTTYLRTTVHISPVFVVVVGGLRMCTFPLRVR